MLPDRVLNPEPLTYESGALLIALRGPAVCFDKAVVHTKDAYRMANRVVFDQTAPTRNSLISVCFVFSLIYSSS